MIQLEKMNAPRILNGYQDYLPRQSYERIDIKKFLDLWISVTIGIVTGLDRHGVVRITKLQLSELGYSDAKTFEDEVLYDTFKKVEKITGIDIDEIRIMMKYKIEYV